MLHSVLASRPELAIFCALIVGYAVGSVKVGPFQLGGVAGTLLAALVIGQLGVQIDPSLQRFMFTLFIYAMGFSVAPQFFASVDRTTWTWTLLVACEVVIILVVVLISTWLFKLDVGTASGLLAGAATESAVVGTASDAIGKLALPPAELLTLQANVATAYGLCYMFGLITIVLFASQVAPWLLRIDLRSESRRMLAQFGGIDLNLDADQRHSFSPLVSRGFSVTNAAGKSVSIIEDEIGGNAAIEFVRRGGVEIPATQDFILNRDDQVGVTGLRTALANATASIGPELGDPTAVDYIVETRDVVYTCAALPRASASAIAKLLRDSGCRGVYLAGITRMERNIPLMPDSVLHHGDVLRVFGRPENVAEAAHLLGFSEAPGITTDFVYLGGGLFIGILVGLITIPVAGVQLSLGSAGAMLSGLLFGWLRSRRPTFGAFPSAAAQILKDLGLAVFIAAIGLNSAPSVLSLLEKHGWELPMAAVLVSLLPALASLYIGRYVLHINPAILCGAIAGQHASTPAIQATEAVAGNPVPVVGYTVTYAVANIVLPLLGPVLVAVLVAAGRGSAGH